MNDMVSIPMNEYSRLLSAAEELADLKAVQNFLNNPQEGMPDNLVKRMIEGEAPLKLWREYRGLSQSELAQRSGVNRVQIGDIEARGKAGSVDTLKKLSEALDVTVDDLLA